MFKSDSSEDIEFAVGEGIEVSAEKTIVENRAVYNNTVPPKSRFLFPERFSEFIYQNHARPLKAGLMVLVFITALYTKAYTGDFQMVINNHIGGIFYVVFGSLTFSLLLPRLNMFLPVVMATGATCFLEFIQWFQFPFMTGLAKIKVFAYLFGNSFNATDFIYYGFGSLLAILILWLIREN